MAGRGAPPKPPSELRRRNLAPALTVVEADGKTHGPELPESVDWPDVTVAWWDTWRKSAQAQTFTDTDWSFLLDTAILHMEFWDGDRALAAELRLRAAKFGATPEDRARLKMSIGDPSKTKAAARTPQADRRSRLLKAVGDDEA